MSGDPSLDELDAYLDVVPRHDAEAVAVGAFTLFVGRGAYRYYARTARAHRGAAEAGDLAALEAACRRHRTPLAIEWLHELHPEVAALARARGLEVELNPLLVAHEREIAGLEAADPDVVIRRLGPDDPAVADAYAAQDVAFAEPGTATGQRGSDARAAARARVDSRRVEHLRWRLRIGLTIMLAAEYRTEGIVAAGTVQPIGGLAELTAIATLPAHRRRGLAGALTARLAHEAARRGASTLLLSAADEEVARVYERAGFHRVGHAGAAEARRAGLSRRGVRASLGWPRILTRRRRSPGG